MEKKSKQKFRMKNIGNEPYYTTNEYLHKKKVKRDKAEDIKESWCVLLLFLGVILTLVPMAAQEETGWNSLAAWIITSVGGLILIADIILYCICCEIMEKNEWEREFLESKEFQRQCNKYAKLKKQKKDKEKTEKARKLVETYDVLDNQGLSKQEKIEEIKKYID